MLKSKLFRLFLSLSTLLVFSSCMRPPNNDFKQTHRAVGGTAVGATLGAAVAGLTKGAIGTGALYGGVAGLVTGTYLDSRAGLKYQLSKAKIQVIEYGDIVTLWIPTDPYFNLNRDNLNDVEYGPLNNVVKFIKSYPNSTIYVAGFADDVGGVNDQLWMTDHRSQMVLSYLWAHGVALEKLDSQGYGNHFTLADDDYVDGSALNRRIELQWRSHGTII